MDPAHDLNNLSPQQCQAFRLVLDHLPWSGRLLRTPLRRQVPQIVFERGANMAERALPLVLVVDDDDAFHGFMHVLLERGGFHVDDAHDGLEAIRMLRTGHYATILLDLMMPRFNGFEVLWHLKALQPKVLDRVVVMTAASDATLRALDEKLVYAVLRKPFDLDAILSVVSVCSQRTVAV
jgi:CheY-like chemotaxis protein